LIIKSNVSNSFITPFGILLYILSMLGGSFVTTAWCVLRLRMEETPSSFGGWLRIYWISSRGQPTRGGLPAWELGVGLTTPHRKK
jgi:hypothetical protein